MFRELFGVVTLGFAPFDVTRGLAVLVFGVTRGFVTSVLFDGPVVRDGAGRRLWTFGCGLFPLLRFPFGLAFTIAGLGRTFGRATFADRPERVLLGLTFVTVLGWLVTERTPEFALEAATFRPAPFRLPFDRMVAPRLPFDRFLFAFAFPPLPPRLMAICEPRLAPCRFRLCWRTI